MGKFDLKASRDLRRKQCNSQVFEGFQITREITKQTVFHFCIWREAQGSVLVSKIQSELGDAQV